MKKGWTIGNDFTGKLHYESWTGVTNGTEGRIATVDGATEAGHPDAMQVKVLDAEFGSDKAGNVTVGKSFGDFELHATGAGLNGDHAGIGESQITGKNTVSGNEITYTPGTAVKALMWGAAIGGSAALAAPAIAARVLQAALQ